MNVAEQLQLSNKGHVSAAKRQRPTKPQPHMFWEKRARYDHGDDSLNSL